MSNDAHKTLAKLLERHGSWELLALVLHERIDTLVAVYGGAAPSPALADKLAAQIDVPPTPPYGVRRP